MDLDEGNCKSDKLKVGPVVQDVSLVLSPSMTLHRVQSIYRDTPESCDAERHVRRDAVYANMKHSLYRLAFCLPTVYRHTVLVLQPSCMTVCQTLDGSWLAGLFHDIAPTVA